MKYKTGVHGSSMPEVTSSYQDLKRERLPQASGEAYTAQPSGTREVKGEGVSGRASENRPYNKDSARWGVLSMPFYSCQHFSAHRVNLNYANLKTI